MFDGSYGVKRVSFQTVEDDGKPLPFSFPDDEGSNNSGFYELKVSLKPILAIKTAAVAMFYYSDAQSSKFFPFCLLGLVM